MHYTYTSALAINFMVQSFQSQNNDAFFFHQFEKKK